MTKTTIIRDFQFTRDFRSIEWRATLWYNLLRATAAGLVIATAQMLLPSSKEVSALSALAVIPMMPVAYLAFIVPLSLLVSLLRSVPFVGLIGLLLAVMVAIGDPLVALLKRIWPAAVPVDDPALFSLAPVFWVLKAEEYAIAG